MYHKHVETSQVTHMCSIPLMGLFIMTFIQLDEKRLGELQKVKEDIFYKCIFTDNIDAKKKI